MRVTAKTVHQARRRAGSVRFVESEPTCHGGLECRAEAVLGTTDEEMQMTPREPQEAVRLNESRFRERCRSARRERVHREGALQISQAAGASLHVRLVLRRRRPVMRVTAGARHG